jgi:N-glycosylase/DNA lyase
MKNCNPEVNSIEKLKKVYGTKKPEILNRLKDFNNTWNKEDNKIFAELCFCILTPQSKAEVCDGIINRLEKNKLLFKGSACKIWPYLKKARFYKNKSRYIVEARVIFQNNGRLNLKDKLDKDNIEKTREWLVENVKGMGYKEASHFLRNIGLGERLAILDVHILRNLKKFGVIKDIPITITKKIYLDIENKFMEFANRIKIPIAHLDLLFWSMGTGRIFK